MANQSKPSLKQYQRRLEILKEDKELFEKQKANPPPKNSTDSPPKTKSHYFVQHNTGKGNLERCPECGNEFVKKRYNQIYCSRECYKTGHAKQVLTHYHQNSDEINKKRRERNRIRRANTPKKPRKPYPVKIRDRRVVTKRVMTYKKCIIIKAQLFKLELLTIQVLSGNAKAQNRKDNYNMYGGMPRGIDEDKVEFIRQKLSEYDLPQGYSTPVDFDADPEIDVDEPKKWIRTVGFKRGENISETIAGSKEDNAEDIGS